MLEVESADRAVVFLEDDIEDTVEVLYPELKVSEASVAGFKKAFGGLRIIAFAGRRRRQVIETLRWVCPHPRP